MDESRDAFTATELIENYSGSSNINITLKRPFAKLRVVTTDINNLTNLGIVPTTATVEYTTTHRVAFNAFEGKAADASESKTHSYTINPYSNETNTGAEYTLFTDYFFAENDIVKFNFKVYEDEAKTKLIKENNFVTDINVKRNHLTTIKGNILTDGKGFDVSIEDGFENGGGKQLARCLTGAMAGKIKHAVKRYCNSNNHSQKHKTNPAQMLKDHTSYIAGVAHLFCALLCLGCSHRLIIVHKLHLK